MWICGVSLIMCVDHKKFPNEKCSLVITPKLMINSGIRVRFKWMTDSLISKVIHTRWWVRGMSRWKTVNGGISVCGWKSFRLSRSIVDRLTLEGECWEKQVWVESLVWRSLTLIRKMDTWAFINVRIHTSIILSFSMNMWYVSHKVSCS